MSVLRFVWATMTLTAALFLVFFGITTAFWALWPICTSCVRSSRRINSDSAVTAADEPGWSTLRINQLQVYGTHNSYHRHSYLPPLSPNWEYHFPSLASQLDAGVRHLELDIHYDWKTGRWFVFHLSVLDAGSTCSCLSECLRGIREWSDAHPTHHILFIEIELKLCADFLQLCGHKTPDANHAAFQTLQKTAIEEFSRERILTPQTVRGDYDTLADAITETTNAYQLFEPSPASSWSESSSDSSTDHTFFGYGGASGSSHQAHNSSTTTTGDEDGSSGSGGSGGSGSGKSSFEEGMLGGWPLVDDTRGMVLLIIDYQSKNRLCRPAIRKALPADETVFFERTPLDEVGASPFLAFGETRVPRKVQRMVRSGVIVRNRIRARDLISGTTASEDGDEDADQATYIVDTAAQLVVYDDLTAVRARTTVPQNDDADSGVSTSLPCKSRCNAIVPKDQCVLEGFC